MNWLQRFLLTRIAKELVRQGPTHLENMTEYYAILAKATREEFTEDNKPTFELLLSECHKESLARVKFVVDQQARVVIVKE